MRTLKLSLGERRKLHKVALAIYVRLIAKSAKFQPIINTFENSAVSFSSLFFICLGFAAAGLGTLTYGALLAERLGWAFLSLPVAPILVGALGGFISFLFFGRLGRLFSRFPLFQQVAQVFVFQQKFLNPRGRTQMATAALQWLQRQPEMTFEAVNYLYQTRKTASIFPRRLRQALEELDTGSASVLLIRDFFERKFKLDYLRHKLMSPRDLSSYEKRYFIQSRAARNGIRASLVFDALGAELRDEIATGEQWRRARHTDENQQITTLRDNADISLRYRTGAPHYRWPDAGRETSQGETAPWLLYMAVENPVNMPLWVITIDDIMDKMHAAAAWLYADEALSGAAMEAEVQSILTLLSTTDINMFGKWDERTLRQKSEVALIPQPVLRNVTGDPENPAWILRWDPNRIDWSQFVGTDGAIRRAFAALLKAIELADAEADRVVLKRGDALLINNLRAMVRRRELGSGGTHYIDSFFDYPEAWWLNVYYGFRRSAPSAFFGI